MEDGNQQYSNQHHITKGKQGLGGHEPVCNTQHNIHIAVHMGNQSETHSTIYTLQYMWATSLKHNTHSLLIVVDVDNQFDVHITHNQFETQYTLVHK